MVGGVAHDLVNDPNRGTVTSPIGRYSFPLLTVTRNCKSESVYCAGASRKPRLFLCFGLEEERE